MADQLELCEKMALVRNRGLNNARELGVEVERLSDWREHVRAYPVPLTLAALALGYLAVPMRRASRTAVVRKSASGGEPSIQSADDSVSGQAARVKTKVGLGSAAMGFVGSLIGNAVRSYVSEQVHTLINPRGQHDTPNQR